MESTHLMLHPEYIAGKDLVGEKFRPGKRRNDVCLIKMEHNEKTRSYMTIKNFPSIPCRLEPQDDINEVKILIWFKNL